MAQQAVADVENILFRDSLTSVELHDPLFITALPRSGTTILLKLLWETDRFAAHTYRDMPFILCPLLWNHFSRHFVIDDEPRERAHGDGLEVSSKSPEAFEEMVWKHFWSNHYRPRHIVPWTASERNAEFDAFLDSHMRKIIALRSDSASDRRRYLSKNNLNIARLAAPPEPLRRGIFLIPFRTPLQQAASMLRQHKRFVKIHDDDPFTHCYMDAIGHHEFGRGLKPVDFGEWLKDAPSPFQLEFWVRYWNAAYQFVLDHAGDASRIISYATLTEEPERGLSRLARAIGVPKCELIPMSDDLHPPRTHEVDTGELNVEVVEEASTIHRSLKERAEV